MKLKRKESTQSAHLRQLRQAELSACRSDLQHAFAFLQMNLLGEAETLYLEVLQKTPEQPEALHFLGSIALIRADFETAVRLISQSLTINSKNPDGYNNLGYALLSCGQPEKAIVALEQALVQKWDHAEALNNLGNARQKIGDLAGAEECYQKAVVVQPRFAKAHYNLGAVYQSTNRSSEAIAAYLRTLEIQPSNAKACNNLALIYKEQGRNDDAIALLRQVVALEPDNERILQTLGIMLMEKKQFAEALGCFGKILRLNPDNTTAQHLHAALSGNNPDAPPPEYVEEIFDHYAPFFEKHLTEKLQYRIPALLRETLGEMTGQETRFSNVIDLGCGTGLAGLEFREMSDRLTGIDISASMIGVARGKNVYDRLCHGGVSKVLDELNEEVDLFVAADVLVYLGDLQPLFSSMVRRASQGAYFLFSIEATSADGFILLPSGRYAHSSRYIADLAGEWGWTIRKRIDSVIRKEDETDISGEVYLLQFSR